MKFALCPNPPAIAMKGGGAEYEVDEVDEEEETEFSDSGDDRCCQTSFV